MKMRALAAVFAAGLSLAAVADRTVNENVTLNADADWRADGTITIASGVTIDLNGHKLQVAALAGDGQVVDTAANPYYRRLEYIQSSANTAKAATQYIDLGWYHGAGGYAVESEYCAVPSGSDWPTLCGNTSNYGTGSYVAFNKNCTEFSVRTGTQNAPGFGKVGDAVANEFRYFKFLVKSGAQTLYYGTAPDNVTTSTSTFGGTLNCNYNWYLFAANNKNGAEWSMNAKIKYLKIYSSADTQDSTTLVRDYIAVKLVADLPAEKDSQGVARLANTIGLWDLKEGKFYCGKTATPFTGGDEVDSGSLEIEVPAGAATLPSAANVDDDVYLKYCVYTDRTLGADADWRTTKGWLSVESGATVDLYGNRLYVNNVIGNGTITDSVTHRYYHQLEYIQSSANTARSATQYIDLGWYNAGDYAVESEYCAVLNTDDWPTFCGSTSGYATGSYIAFNKACTDFSVRTGAFGTVGPAVANEFRYFKFLVKTGNQTLYYGTDPDNVTTSTSTYGGTLTCNYNWYLFAVNNKNNVDYAMNAKLKYLKIYSSADTQDSTTLVRDLIPVKLTAALAAERDSQGVAREADTIGLWDRVNGKFYGSKTATPFTAGNELASGNGYGELHLDVPEGKTVNSLSVALAGGLKLVKDGAGTYKPNAAKGYDGGTVVNAGRVAQTGVAGSLGTGKDFEIKDGATLELDATSPSIFVSENIDVYAEGAGPDGDGAIVRNNGTAAGFHLQNLHLTGDAVIGGSKRIDFRSSGSGIDGEGCTLTIKNTHMVAPCEGANHITLQKLVIDGGVYQPCMALATYSIPGGIELINGGILSPWSSFTHSANVPISVGVGGGTIRNDNGTPTIAGNITIAADSTLTMRNPLNFTGAISGGAVELTGAATSFANYDAASTAVSGTGALTVTSKLKPAADGSCYPCSLIDGVAVDLADYTSVVPFDSIVFTPGTKIKVDIDGRELAFNEQVASWTVSPENVEFTWDDTTAASTTAALIRRSADGIYYGSAPDSTEVAIAVWNGANGASASDPANWTCVNHSRLSVTDGLPGAAAEILISGTVNLQAADALNAWRVTVKDGTALSADCDWRGLGPLNIEAGALLDLKGHKLYTTSFIGAAEITDTVGGGELHVDVAEGVTFSNPGTKLSGLLKLVKDGAGVYEVNNPQSLKHTYEGGTQVAAGEMRLGPNGGASDLSYCPSYTFALGQLGTTLTVESGAVFNVHGQYDMYVYPVVLNGGTLKNDVHQQNSSWYSMGDVRLTADSYCDTDGDLLWGWGSSTSSTPNGTLDLGGHTLDVTVRSHYFSYKGTNMVNGTLKVSGAGGLALWHKSKDFQTVDIDMGAAKYDAHGGSYVKVRNFINRQPNDDECGNYYATTVYGTFKPVTDFFHDTVLENGATLDLSGRVGPFSPISAITPVNRPQKKLTFAENALIFVDIHGRNFVAEENRKVIEWDEPPAGVKFKADTASHRAGYRLVAREDGLYVESGFVIIIH